MTYRDALPQLEGDFFITDGGIETTLIFHDGLELPDFASFYLYRTQDGTAALERYFRSYADIARRLGLGIVLESATWRSNPDWGARLGYSTQALDAANRQAIDQLVGLRSEYVSAETPVVISGCVGPRGDGYAVESAMTADEARAYHSEQIGTFADTAADMITAITMTYIDEAIGLTLAARDHAMPVVISFTVETDATVPAGDTLEAAIEAVDAATDGYPAYYMINCAHPSHFDSALEPGEPWVERIRGLRANASRMSHEELDEAPELDVGDAVELGGEHADLKRRLPQLAVMGGCCGTDASHIEQIARACKPLFE